MIKRIGRIIARKDVVGLYLPLGDKSLHGIYEIRECLGEMTIHRIGDPAMPEPRFQGLDLTGLFNASAQAGMTQAELDEAKANDPTWD